MESHWKKKGFKIPYTEEFLSYTEKKHSALDSFNISTTIF